MARQLKETALITISKAGGKASQNTLKYRAALPNKWMQEMEIDLDNRLVDILFDGEQIIIQKASNKSYPNFEKTTVNIQISSSGGGASADTLRYNVAFLNRWMQELEVVEDDRCFKRDFKDGKIIFTRLNKGE